VSVICLDPENYKDAASLIAVCKSDSRKKGVILRNAHYKLGSLLTKQIVCNVHDQSITVVIMMRAGLCFGMGIADTLEQSGIETRILFFQNNELWEKEQNNCPCALDNTVLVVDAVINSGKGIIDFSKQLMQSQQIIFVANVLSEKGIKNFEDKEVYAVRISKSSFIGSKNDTVTDGKGPDTGDRLFNTR
jgi:uracil phosphoribosyltransferase